MAASFVFAGGATEDREKVLYVAGLKGPSSIGMLPMFADPPDYGWSGRAEFSVVDEPQIMTARILSGEVDIAAVPVNLAAVLYNKGAGIKIAAIIGNGVIHLVSNDPEVKSLQDVRGRRIYCIAQGSNPEYIMKYVLEHSGIEPDKDVELDFTFGHNELAAQLAAGKVQIGVLPEPFVTVVRKKNPEVKAVVDLQEAFGKASGLSRPYPATALVVRAGVYERNPGLVGKFLDDYRETLPRVFADPEKTGELALQYIGLPAALVAEALPRLNLEFTPATERKDDLRRFYEILYAYNPASIGGKVPDEAIYP